MQLLKRLHNHSAIQNDKHWLHWKEKKLFLEIICQSEKTVVNKQVIMKKSQVYPSAFYPYADPTQSSHQLRHSPHQA